MPSLRSKKRPPIRRGISLKLILGAAVGLVFASFGVLGAFLYFTAGRDPSQQLEVAFRVLRKGDGELSAKIARSLDPKSITKRGDVSKREFLLGAHERELATKTDQRRIRTEKNEKAVKHLSRSRNISFPEGYEGQGNYHLGMALYELFRWEEAESPLEIAAERWPQGRADSIERLIDIDLSFENKDTESAMERIAHWRSLPHSSVDEYDRTIVKEMHALFVENKYHEAATLLNQLKSESNYRPVAELVYGRSLFRIAEKSQEPERSEKLKLAGECFQRVMINSKIPIPYRRQSNLELGRTQRSLGDLIKAVSTFSTLRLASPSEPECLVSGLEEIDCFIDLARFDDVITTMEHISRNFGELAWYQNDWMPISDMRKKLLQSGERLLSQGAYATATKFSKLLPPFCDLLDRLRIDCRGYEQLANQLKGRDSSGAVEQYYRESANAYAALSRHMMRLPNYPELVMKAVENYRNAGAFAESNRLLDTLLQYEARENQPIGLLIKARNYCSLNQPDLAMQTLDRILESNLNTSLIYDARLESARLLAAKDQFQEAEELILQNLYYSDLKPESPVWRDSLIELGELSFRRGEKLQSQAINAILETPGNTYENLANVEKSFQELERSIERIEDGLRRFQSDPRRLRMLYTTAKAYQLASTWPELLLKENRIANDETIAGWKAQRKRLLNESRLAYRRLREEVINAVDSNTPIPNSEKFLRNSFFGEADLLFDDGEYEEAWVAYRDASSRFINEPESIEAMVQIANCQKELGKIGDCRRTLEYAKDVLQKIPVEKDNRFKLVTSHDRTGWEQYLDWMLSQLPTR